MIQTKPRFINSNELENKLLPPDIYHASDPKPYTPAQNSNPVLVTLGILGWQCSPGGNCPAEPVLYYYSFIIHDNLKTKFTPDWS